MVIARKRIFRKPLIQLDIEEGLLYVGILALAQIAGETIQGGLVAFAVLKSEGLI